MSPGPVGATEDALAGKLAGEMPPPTPGAVEAEAAETREPTLLDRLGRAFDPAIHQTVNGKPKITRDGRVAIKQGTGGRSKPTTSEQGKSTLPPNLEAPQDENAATRGVAALTVANEIALLTILFGPAWKPAVEENAALVEAWATYYKEKGIEEVSPTALLLLVHTGYAAKRIGEDAQTKTRLAALRDRAKLGLRRMFRRRRGAFADPGDNGERKDGAGDATRRGVPEAGH